MRRFKKLIPFFLIVSQIFGAIGGYLQIPRVLALLFLPILLLNYKKEMKKYKIIYFFFFIYLVVQLVFLIYDSTNSLVIIKYFSYSCVNFLIFIQIVNFSLDLPSIKLFKYWFYYLFLTIPIALYELIFDVHFYTSNLGSDNIAGGTGKLLKYAGITFGNYNLYNYILAIGMPFVLYYYSNITKKTNKLFVLTSLFFLVGIVAVNNSRGALICFFITFLIYVFSRFKGSSSLYKIMSVFVLGLMFFILSGIEGLGGYFSDNRIIRKGFNDDSRTEMIRIGIEMFFNSNMLGVGPGGFIRNASNYTNGHIFAPHNIFIEIISEYGIIVFLSFLLLLKKCFLPNIDILKRGGILKYLVITMILIYPIAHTINSVYLDSQYTWIFLATMFAITNNFKLGKNDK